MGMAFPNTPTPGDKYTPAGTGMPTYTWDGEKWTTVGGAIGTGGAPLDSPAFIGNPTAPTPAPGDDDTSLATTHFVKQAVDAVAALLPVAATLAEYRANSAPTKMLTPGVVWGSGGVITLVDGATVTPDLSLGSDFAWTVGAAGRTLANPTNGKAGQKGIIYIVSNVAITWGSAYKFPNGGVKPTLSGNTMISYSVGNDNATMYCTAGPNMA